jgi:chromosomal replication initiator protein
VEKVLETAATREMWSRALGRLKADLPQSSFEMWFSEVRARQGKDGGLELVLPSDYVRSWLASHYAEAIADAVTGAAGRTVPIRFVTEPLAERTGEDAAGGEVRRPEPPPLAPSQPEVRGSPFSSKYTFETFVPGDSNRFAYAAAMAVAEAPPSKAYNPLFIYGGVGLGKTHLLQAIANHMMYLTPMLRVKYVTSEAFVTEFIKSVREGQGYLFQRRHRDVDVLLVDDIQFLAGKEETQTEFFHTFNTLHGTERQIVIASDRPPQELAALEERLRNRFRWGLCVDIQPPNLETRIAILQQKALRDGLEVPDVVLTFVAEKFDANIRELEGALLRVVATASLSQQPVDLPMAERTLEDLLPQGGEVPAEIILAETARYFGLRREDLVSKSRSRPLTTARHVAMYILRELTQLSLVKIGELFDRDHTTVMHGIQKVERLMVDRDATYRQVQALSKVIRGTA